MLVKALEYGACVDQLNLACLAGFEVIALRIQATVDILSTPGDKPNWHLAKYYTGTASASQGVDPSLRNRVLQQSKLERESMQGLQRGKGQVPAQDGYFGDGADKGGGRGGGGRRGGRGGKEGGKGLPAPAEG